MKIIFLSLLISSIFTYGQFYENFDSNSKLPDGWISYKGDNRAGDDFDNWKIFNVEKTNDKCAFVRYENSGKLNEDWLVTQKIDLKDYKNNFLSFLQKNSFVDTTTKYEIKISTLSQYDRSTFKTIQTFNDSIITKEFYNQKIDLSTFDKKEIFIAFVKIEDDGNNWFIDNVTITGDKINKIHQVNNIFFPNPTTGVIQYKNNKIKIIYIFNMTNVLLKTFNSKSIIDISNLPEGIYYVKSIFKDGTTKMEKIIKKN